jgi:hypothetical protein
MPTAKRCFQRGMIVAQEVGKVKCSSCGYLMSELDKQCPRCKSPNMEWSSNPMYRRGGAAERLLPERQQTANPKPAVPAASGGSIATMSTTAATAPPASETSGLGAFYTPCVWQRPDGKWLNSKQITEIEQLAHKYVTIRPSGNSGGLNKLVSMIGVGKSKDEAVEKIKKRVTEIGIPFGIFQAYANSLRD